MFSPNPCTAWKMPKYVGLSTAMVSPCLVTIFKQITNASRQPAVITISSALTLPPQLKQSFATCFLNSLLPCTSSYCKHDVAEFLNACTTDLLSLAAGNQSADGAATERF